MQGQQFDRPNSNSLGYRERWEDHRGRPGHGEARANRGYQVPSHRGERDVPQSLAVKHWQSNANSDRNQRGAFISNGNEPRQWICMCKAANSRPPQHGCERCGRSGPRPRGLSHGFDRDSRVYDIAPQMNAAVGIKKVCEWPPIFEENGGAFIFDSRCGMFYESVSDFYYDPKTKLYFGNKKQKYFMFCPEQNPPFVPVESHTEVTVDTSSLNEGNDIENGTSTAFVSEVADYKESEQEIRQAKNKIAISIGGGSVAKKLGQKSELVSKKPPDQTDQNADDGKRDTVAVQVFHIRKRDAKNIDKWKLKTREIREPVNHAVTCEDEVKRTADGKPICVLCKRKFASLEKLREHEKISSLHQENLAKAEKASSITEYRDRARERRQIFGTAKKSNAQSASTLNDEATPTPQDNLGESNIGNQILQKLGWKGDGLGKGNSRKDDNSPDNVTENLKRDWERIESLASGAHPKRSKMVAGLGNI